MDLEPPRLRFLVVPAPSTMEAETPPPPPLRQEQHRMLIQEVDVLLCYLDRDQGGKSDRP